MRELIGRPYRIAREEPIELLDRPFTMLKASIPTLQTHQHFVGRAASALLHCALAIILLSIAGPEAGRRRSHVTPLYFSPGSSTVGSPKVTFPPGILTLSPAPTRHEAIPSYHPPSAAVVQQIKLALAETLVIPAPLKLPAVSNSPANPAAAYVPMAPVPMAPVPPHQPETHMSGFDSRAMPVDAARHAGARDAAVTIQPSGFDSATAQTQRNAHTPMTSAAVFGGPERMPARTQAGVVASTSFDDVAATSSPRGDAAKAASALRSPLEILSKPRPLYTEEARRLRIEGDVVLQVSFRASTEICVLRVLRGLGHGLDENAISAASAIHFRPASDGERPIDEIAIVRITFQLAD